MLSVPHAVWGTRCVCVWGGLAVLKEELGAMDQKLGAVETRLQANVSQVEEVKSMNKVQEEELKTLKKKDLAAGQPKVAFSAALRTYGSGNIGPFTTDIPLQYKSLLQRRQWIQPCYSCLHSHGQSVLLLLHRVLQRKRQRCREFAEERTAAGVLMGR